MAVEGTHTFKRPIYAGNAIVTVEAPAGQTVVATMRAASWAGGRRRWQRAGIEAATVDVAASHIRHKCSPAAGQVGSP
jgi:electron transfer flavoprotein alpha subunit